MFFVSNKKIQKLIVGIICVCIIGAPLSAHLSLKETQAALITVSGGGRIVYDPQNTLTNTLQTITAQALQQKLAA